ncbi:MAG: hypothetical protein U9R74_00710 [Pseudomonadota bacterium]|nr:hypothetical protein [Pseudomonadota bacterium]
MMSRGVDGIIINRVALARRGQGLRTELTHLGRFVVCVGWRSRLAARHGANIHWRRCLNILRVFGAIT